VIEFEKKTKQHISLDSSCTLPYWSRTVMHKKEVHTHKNKGTVLSVHLFIDVIVKSMTNKNKKILF
jgi:hypothetical protein